MVSDQEIASCVESLLRSSVGAGEAASLAAVLQRAQARLGVDLSHKAAYIRDQMDLFFGPRLQPTPPPPPKSQQQAPPPSSAPPMAQQQPQPPQQVQLQLPLEMQQQFAAIKPQYIFQTMPQQLPPAVSNAANATAVSASPPVPVPAMAFYPPPPLAFRYANALGGVATGGTLSFQQPAPAVGGMASPTTAAPAGADNKES